MSHPGGADRDALEEALLAFQLMPGKYAVARREPPLLFAAMPQVLQVANGRLGDAAEPSPLVRQAACFFIRSALLGPGADHYTLLGLPRDAPPTTIKEHYRLLMRLMHPDFADASGRSPWPSDAAARVNRAYEVLASAVQRRDYDDTLAAAAEMPRSQRPSAAKPGRAVPVLRRTGQPAAADRRQPLKRLAGVFGAVGALALLVLVASGGSDKETLVQRSRESRPPAPAVPAGADAQSPVLAALAPAPDDAPPELAAARMPTPAPRMNLQPARELAPGPQRVLRAAHAAPAAPPALPDPKPAAVRTESLAAVPLVAALAEARPADAFTARERPAAQPGLTLAEAHPVLTQVLQQLESGRTEAVLGLLEHDARNTPAAQALVRHYAGLVEGTRPIRIANAHFRAEPREGRLLVIGHVLIQLGDAPPAKELAMQAEFVSRGGQVVMTRLARAGAERADK